MISKRELALVFPQSQSDIVYLDSAATALKYKPAVDMQYKFELNSVANVHRGAHRLSSEATTAFELTRKKTADYLKVNTNEVIFTKGTTDAVNLLAFGLKKWVEKNDVILLTEMEHHANLLPWQRLAADTGAKLKFISVNSKGDLDLGLGLEKFEQILKEGKVKILALSHVSNTLGTVNPIKEMAAIAKKYKVKVVVDGAQAATCFRVFPNDLDVDFYFFSAHKVFGPFGLGILWGKEELLNQMEPYQLGGAIIDKVEFEKSTFLNAPHRFEAGTPSISAVIAFSKIIDFLENLDFNQTRAHEKELLDLSIDKLSLIPGFKMVGESETKVNILSFNFDGVHPSDLCSILDEQNVALRSGHHCTQPLLKKLGISGTARASFSLYNSTEDVNKFVAATKKALEILT